MMYLTGASNKRTRALAYDVNLGLILNPESYYEQHVPDYPAFAIDNGCYSQGERFSLPRYLGWLKKLQPYQHKCLFAVAPDVFHPAGMHDGVTIAEATWERSKAVLPLIRALGYKAALVAQDGILDTDIQWDAFDALFIGMTTSSKLSIETVPLIWEAKARGKWVHMGRVNSATRFGKARDMGCDSCDGTYIKFGPNVNLQNVVRWLGYQQSIEKEVLYA